MDQLYVIDKKYLDAHKKELNWLKEEFFEYKSQKAFEEYLDQKIAGIYEKQYTGNQYFDNEIIRFGEDEVFVDCGSFTGDTVEMFISNLKKLKIEKWKQIYAIEAKKDNYERAKKNLEKYNNVVLINKGCWNYSGTHKFIEDEYSNSASAIQENGNSEIEVDTIDNIIFRGEEGVTFIKMDIEGAELNALKGAEQTIRKYKPKLAISIYHKPEDLYEIPQYIKSLVPEYKLYFRNHAPSATESVLYAVL